MPETLPDGFVLDAQPAEASDVAVPEGFVLDNQPREFGLGDTWPARLAKSLLNAIQYTGDVARGEKQVMDPTTGHVSDEAIAHATNTATLLNPAPPGAVTTQGMLGVARAEQPSWTAKVFGQGKTGAQPAAPSPAAAAPLVNEVAQASERLGVPVPQGAASESPAIQSLYQRGRQVPGASGVVERSLDDFYKGTESKVGDLAAQAAGGQVKDPATLGASVRSSLEGAVKRSEEQADNAFGVMRRVIDPEKRVQALDGAIAREMDQIMGQRTAAGESGIAERLTPTFSILTDPKGVSFNGLQRARSQVGRAIQWDEANGGFLAADLKQAYGALTEAMENSVGLSARSNPEAAVRLWKAADVRFAKMMEDNKVLGSVLRKDADEALARSLISMASNKTGNLRKLTEVINQIGPGSHGDLAGYVIQNLGVGRNGQFSAQAFTTNWQALSTGGKSLLFRDPVVRKSLDDLATITARMAEVQRKFDNSSRTAGAIGQMATTAGLVTNPIQTIATLVGANVAARVLSKPATAKAALDLARAQEAYLKAPSRAALQRVKQAEARLAKLATKAAGAAANDNSGVPQVSPQISIAR